MLDTTQTQETLKWLQAQIQHANSVIKESQQELNFGREAQYEGMREAYMQVLNWIHSRSDAA
ncbi:MAG: hypothetical protein IT233_13380 [Bacteroidia bacterium]|nr:hypothetical protein [Bacteroidia bacterium]